MRTVYALQFEIIPDTGKSPTTILQEIRQLLKEWVQANYYRRQGINLNLVFDGEPITPLQGHQITASHKSYNEFELLSLDWTHTESETPLTWATTCTFGTDGERIDASCIVRMGYSTFGIKPLGDFTLGRPKVIERILKAYNCQMNCFSIPSTFEYLKSDDDVQDFITNTLLNPTRQLPVILLSEDVWTEQPFTDPAILQTRLLGYAKVVLVSKLAGFKLTEIVGKRLSCFNGAIRIYWPGLTVDSNPFAHHLFLQDQLLQIAGDEPNKFNEYIFKMLSELASLSLVEGKTARRVKVAFETKRTEEIVALRQQINDKSISQDELETKFLLLLDDVSKLQQEKSKIRSEKDTAEYRILELEEELETWKDNLNKLKLYEKPYDQTAMASETVQEEELGFDSVLDALEKAQKRFSRNLCIWDSAIDAAKKSQFKRRDEVYSALKAINEITQQYFANNKRIGSSLETAFAAYGCNFRPTEHQNTLTMYGDERIFKNNGQQKQMLMHLTLGGGDRNNCLQIYFEFDEDTKMTNVGYCGFHLPYASQRT